MAKITYLDGRMNVILQKDFNLWLLGLQVLTNDIKDAYKMFNKLIN